MLDNQRVIKIFAEQDRKNGAKWPQKAWFCVVKAMG